MHQERKFWDYYFSYGFRNFIVERQRETEKVEREAGHGKVKMHGRDGEKES